MARPCKSAKVLHPYSQTLPEMEYRIQQEEVLRGSGEVEEPDYLTENQLAIFRHIVGNMKEAGILGSSDVYVLTECSIAIDRMQDIEKRINDNPDLIFDTKLMSTKERYTKAFFRYANELSLSPQSRAKLANINLDAENKSKDPLLNMLSNRGGDNA